MAFSVSQLTALESAIASGVLTVSYEGKTSTFRSLDDLLRMYYFIQRKLGLLPPGSQTILAAHSRGFPGIGQGASNILLEEGNLISGL